MHLEVKKRLPPEGSEWLFMRARSTTKNGRFDAEIMIMYERLELVALSHQIAFIVKGIQVPDEPRLAKKSHL